MKNMVTKNLISEIIGNILNKQILEIDYKRSLQIEFGMDSIALVEVVIGLEEYFDFEFKDEDLIIENFENIDAIYNKIITYTRTD